MTCSNQAIALTEAMREACLTAYLQVLDARHNVEGFWPELGLKSVSLDRGAAALFPPTI
jgi:hypothetical protein